MTQPYGGFARALLLAVLCLPAARAQKPENVLVVVNQSSSLSKSIGEYYVQHREIPLENLCRIKVSYDETIWREEYDKKIAHPIGDYLTAKHLTEKILYIVTTAGMPLRVGSDDEPANQHAAVDSELALLYADMHGTKHSLPGAVPNPFFGNINAAFTHPRFPIYLVTRLAGYDFADVKAMIDRARLAKNTGKFVIDLKADDPTHGNQWLKAAASQLPPDRVILDETAKVLMNEKNVIGYAAWGSNDPERKQRHLGFEWLPGAIVTEFVSSNGRTFVKPPKDWNIGTWGDQKTWFAGSPQTMTADYIHDGATGASGHVDEPYLQFTPRPDLVLPAYYKGRTLAESFYLGLPVLSWQNIILGDPLCSLGKP